MRVSCNDFDSLETECFVFYDDLEKEYFICGLKEDQEHPYKFFCKKRENLMSFIESIVENNSLVTIELLNYPNLFKNDVQADYHLFTNEEAECSVISCQESHTYTASLQYELSRCLKSLKMVRW